MALVVFLRGLNVGGHKTFRPTALVRQLRHLDAVNIGAAGTFIVRTRIGRAQLHAEIARRLPFDAAIMICASAEILRLLSRDYFSGHPVRRDVVRFVSVLAQKPRATPELPLTLPATGKWMLRILASEGRLVVGVYRRHMKVIGYLAALDRIFGTTATTRSWSTLVAVGRVLQRAAARKGATSDR